MRGEAISPLANCGSCFSRPRGCDRRDRRSAEYSAGSLYQEGYKIINPLTVMQSRLADKIPLFYNIVQSKMPRFCYKMP